MSAGLILDIGQSALYLPSIAPAAGVGSTPASGVIIGNIVDTINANTLTNVVVTGGVSLSGTFRVQVQSSPTTASGDFTDPTSGLAVMPTNLLSGGILLCNSGQSLASGGGYSGCIEFGAFLTPDRYVRAIVMSGDSYNAPVFVGFVKQLKQTGSGGGYSYAPQTGTVNV